MKKVLLFVLLIFCVVLYSCRNSNTKKLEDNDLIFDTIRSTVNYHMDNDSTLPSCNLRLTFTYPSESSDKALLDSLQHIFISNFFGEEYVYLDIKEAVKAYEKAYVENYKEDARIYLEDKFADSNPKETYASYYEVDSSSIYFNKGGILSFQVTQINYKGGAASYDFIKNYVVDLELKRLLTEEDIFKEGYIEPLGKILQTKLISSKKVKNLDQLENMGYFGLDELIPNGNFLINDKGITYIFNKGEYSSYKVSVMTLFLPYDEISSLLKEDTSVSRFISK